MISPTHPGLGFPWGVVVAIGGAIASKIAGRKKPKPEDTEFTPVTQTDPVQQFSYQEDYKKYLLPVGVGFAAILLFVAMKK